MNKSRTSAFTLVELIVVITILAILWTIAFISVQSYSANARDSVRIANLTNIDKGLAFLQAKDWQLPHPTGNITTITASGATVMIQWEISQATAEWLLKISGQISDPIDWTLPIYSVTADRTKFQVAMFLEAENLTTHQVLRTSYAADWKALITKWDKIWVILNTDETAINQTSTPVATFELNTASSHIVYLDNTEIISASWVQLQDQLVLAIEKATRQSSSCKDILERWEWDTNWNYTIYIKWEGLQVYCDMTTNWGWWTRYVHIKWNYSFEDAKSCVTKKSNINNDLLFCIDPYDLWTINDFAYIDKSTNLRYETIIDQTYVDIWGSYKSTYKKPIFDLMYVSPTSAAQRVRLWINYKHNHSSCEWGRHPGWSYVSNVKMNYDSGDGWCSGPLHWNREWAARIWEFYVR